MWSSVRDCGIHSSASYNFQSTAEEGCWKINKASYSASSLYLQGSQLSVTWLWSFIAAAATWNATVASVQPAQSSALQHRAASLRIFL